MRDALIDCCEFYWAKISPAVFGSIFQGVMNDRARRQLGAQYTSERDIMKVVHSLFLDELLAEFEQLKRDRSTRRRAGMEAFHQRLRSFQFLDPACGCGNFLVLTYREIRALEIEVVRELSAGVGGQQLLPIVNVDQFHGIEILEWPVRIAKSRFLMTGQSTREHGEKKWTQTEHNLDFIFERDKRAYGIEVKNMLGYMDYKEFKIKIKICRELGILPVFVARMLPKVWVNELWRQGGFALILKWQLYPLAHKDLAKRVASELGLPVDSPQRLADGTMARFTTWHGKNL